MKDRYDSEHCINVLRDLAVLFDKMIKTAQTKEEKFAIATKKFSASALAKLADGQLQLEEVMETAPEDEYHVMNAFALAISLSRLDSVKEMLSLFDKESINNTEHFVWGFRQPYSFMHLAAHPHISMHHAGVTIRFFGEFESEQSRVDTQIAIINLLAKCGADACWVDRRFGIGVYTNPALAAGHAMSHTFFSRDQRDRLRGALLLVGADPDYKGSSFYLWPDSSERTNAMAEAIKQFFSMSQEARAQANSLMKKSVSDVISIELQKMLQLLQPAAPAPSFSPKMF